MQGASQENDIPMHAHIFYISALQVSSINSVKVNTQNKNKNGEVKGLGAVTKIKRFMVLRRVDVVGLEGMVVTVVVYGYTEELNGDMDRGEGRQIDWHREIPKLM